jgi:chemotaxis protein MotB
MSPKYYLPAENGQRDRWMISYMDVLTILLIFFVAIAAQSLQRLRPAPVTATAAPAGPGAATPAGPSVATNAGPAAATHAGPAATVTKALPFAPSQPVNPRPDAIVPEARQTLLRAQQSLEKHGLDLRLEPRGLVISLPQAILFPSGADRVSPQALPMLARIADVLRDIPNEVSLIGHADAVPIHNRQFKNNWDLSMARSLRILELLSRRYGISESRLHIASYGPYRPQSPNNTADGRARNRRVEIVISGESAHS